MKNIILIALCLIVVQYGVAQNVGINETGAAPAASAILDVSAVNKGMLIPRLANQATIVAPATGLIVYNTTTNTFWYFNGVIWIELLGGAAELVDLDGDTRVTVEENPDEDIIRFFAASAIDQMRFNGKTLHFTSTNTLIGNTAGAPTTGTNNTYLGYHSGLVNTTGGNNTFLGSRTGEAITTGQYNLFAGSGAGQVASTSNGNVFLGYWSGYTNAVGTRNVLVGFGSGYLSTGSDNAMLGYQAGFNTSTGEYNVYLGASAGFNATIASNNVLVGYETGYSLTTGSNNIYIGYRAGRAGTTSSNNTVVGNEAGRSFTTALENSFFGSLAGNSTNSGRYNTFLGFNAGRDNTAANANTFVGWRSGFNNTVGFQNTFVGYSAGRLTFSGDNNVFVGHSAGDVCQFGDFNTFVGKSAGATINAGSSNVFLGNLAGGNTVDIDGCVLIGNSAGQSITQSNRLYIANGSTSAQTLVYGEFDNMRVGIGTVAPTTTLQLGLSGDGRTGLATAWNVFSDIRYKKDIQPIKNALSLVTGINGYYYLYKNDATEKQHIGVIAQELETVLPQLVSTDSEGYKSVDYSKLTPVLIEAIKEQQHKIESLEDRITQLEQKMNLLLVAPANETAGLK